jgi:hypothetical protein
MGYEVILSDESTELVDDADSYTQEGPLTTFYGVEPGRPPRLDAWSTKLLSIRTDRIVCIRKVRATRRLALAEERPA